MFYFLIKYNIKQSYFDYIIFILKIIYTELTQNDLKLLKWNVHGIFKHSY